MANWLFVLAQVATKNAVLGNPSRGNWLIRFLESTSTPIQVAVIGGLFAIAVALLNIFANNLIPYLHRQMIRLSSWVGTKLGGRAADMVFERAYLSWLADAHRNLKLIGIKLPRRDPLQQIALSKVFMSLRLRPYKAPTALIDAVQADGPEARAPAAEAPTPPVPRPPTQDTSHPERTAAEPLQSWLRDASRLVILGPPGSGKSTLLQFTTLMLADPRAVGLNWFKRRAALRGLRRELGLRRFRVPIFASLGSIAPKLVAPADPTGPAKDQPRITLVEAIQSTLPDHLTKEPAAQVYFKRQLERQRCLVLLDGLDEVADEEQFDAVIKTVRGYASHPPYKGNRFIVTARLAGYSAELPDDFRVLEVDELTTEDVESFIDNWHAEVGRPRDETEDQARIRLGEAAHEAKELKEKIADIPELGRLSRNPLLLSILVLIHQTGAGLPERRGRLYAACCRFLLNRDAYRGFRDISGLTSGQKQSLLERLALRLHTGQLGRSVEGTSLASVGDCRAVVAEELVYLKPGADADEILKYLVERTGLLVERQRGFLAFAHHTFQEYYCARAYKNEDYWMRARKDAGGRPRRTAPPRPGPLPLVA
jgi:energy-coupling factor transporter ATP-binding protein EcfA2